MPRDLASTPWEDFVRASGRNPDDYEFQKGAPATEFLKAAGKNPDEYEMPEQEPSASVSKISFTPTRFANAAKQDVGKPGFLESLVGREPEEQTAPTPQMSAMSPSQAMGRKALNFAGGALAGAAKLATFPGQLTYGALEPIVDSYVRPQESQEPSTTMMGLTPRTGDQLLSLAKTAIGFAPPIMVGLAAKSLAESEGPADTGEALLNLGVGGAGMAHTLTGALTQRATGPELPMLDHRAPIPRPQFPLLPASTEVAPAPGVISLPSAEPARLPSADLAGPRGYTGTENLERTIPAEGLQQLNFKPQPAQPAEPAKAPRRLSDSSTSVPTGPGDGLDVAYQEANARGLAARIEKMLLKGKDPRDVAAAIGTQLKSQALGETYVKAVMNRMKDTTPIPAKPPNPFLKRPAETGRSPKGNQPADRGSAMKALYGDKDEVIQLEHRKYLDKIQEVRKAAGL
jgi:hypothetical protein